MTYGQLRLIGERGPKLWCQKCAKTHLRASVIEKNFPGLYPGPLFNGLRTPRRGGRGGNSKGGEEREGRGGREAVVYPDSWTSRGNLSARGSSPVA